jgi:hypothetical protein
LFLWGSNQLCDAIYPDAAYQPRED